MPIDPERTSQLRDKMLEHLEAALAIADETQDEEAGNLIDRALDSVRATHWPMLDPVAKRGGSGYLNRISASLSGVSAGFRLPCGGAAG